MAALNRGLAQKATAGWQRVDGTVLSFDARHDENDKRLSPIAYQYQVDGRTYRSDRVAFIDRSNIEYGDWLKLANGLPEQGTIEVYYDPAKPEESVLRKGDLSVSWSGLGFGAIFAGFAAFWMAAWWGMSNWLPDRLEAAGKEREGRDTSRDGYSKVG